MTKRVLLTGGTGFVGANLARRLVRDGYAVHLLVREAAAWRLDGIRTEVALHVADITDRAAVADVVGRVRPDWIFHLAAHGAYSWESDAVRIVATNLIGTGNLVDAGLRTGFEAFVNTGSSSEYGLKDHPPSEDEAVEPNSQYAATKASATLLCRCTARGRNLRMPTLRLYSVYGPYEEPNRVVPALIVHGQRGRLPALTNPATGRDFVYVDDVVDAYLLAATAPLSEPGAVYNIGTGRQTTLASLVEVARRLMDIRADPIWGSMPNRSWDTTTWVADARRARSDLGWQPTHTLEDGFRRTLDWFRGDDAIRRLYASRLRV